MADSGRPTDKSPLSNKVVRSQKIAAVQSPPQRANPSVLDDESDDGDSSEAAPLPRSHTPGHLSSKSIHASRRKPSDLTIRQRSQSTSQVASNRTASKPSKPPPPTMNGVGDASSEGDKEPRRPHTTRTTSTIAYRPTVATPTLSRSGTSAASRARGEFTAYPPLPDPTIASDIPNAPASGMYWSKAPVSGAPHPSLRAHTTTLVGSNVFVFGGCDSRICFSQLYVFDADSFFWSVPHVVGDIPVPLRAMTCTAVGKKLVVFGGGDGPEYYNDVYVLDTTNFRWSKPRILGDKMPSKRRAHTACLYKNGIYVFGGGDGVRALNDIWRLDVSDVNKMSWRLISSADKTTPGMKDYRPKARGYHTANMVGSKLIIFGGSDGGECFDDVWVYDVEQQFWRAVGIPVAFRRLSHTATIVGSYLFVIGGHDGNEYSNDVLLLNLVTMTWDRRRVYGKAPSGRGYHGAVLYDSRVIVIGGFDGSEVFGDVMILELAVHAYYSQISHFTIEV
ncbi:hypothetical protein BGZ63DRAFT_371062 [Mariannaea sp. PMI_226]|nr:hypothetical protein BGZ63DRAFT_371062 [Mariannaea sp. PMI_226]